MQITYWRKYTNCVIASHIRKAKNYYFKKANGLNLDNPLPSKARARKLERVPLFEPKYYA